MIVFRDQCTGVSLDGPWSIGLVATRDGDEVTVRVEVDGAEPVIISLNREMALRLALGLNQVCAARTDDSPSITCPRCGMTSWHPEDVRRRYCGNCHEFSP